jgi:hypothetical protein
MDAVADAGALSHAPISRSSMSVELTLSIPASAVVPAPPMLPPGATNKARLRCENCKAAHVERSPIYRLRLSRSLRVRARLKHSRITSDFVSWHAHHVRAAKTTRKPQSRARTFNLKRLQRCVVHQRSGEQRRSNCTDIVSCPKFA